MALSILLLLLFIVSVLACYAIAKERGANPVFWAVMAALFGPLAVPFVFFSKPK